MSIFDKEIKLLKNNSKRDWTDLQWMDEFFKFLQGEIPDEMRIVNPTKLTPEEAFTIIWYLQEHFPLLPDHIEKCDVCGELYDTWSEGEYNEEGNEYGQHFCGACDHLAPYVDPYEQNEG